MAKDKENKSESKDLSTEIPPELLRGLSQDQINILNELKNKIDKEKEKLKQLNDEIVKKYKKELICTSFTLPPPKTPQAPSLLPQPVLGNNPLPPEIAQIPDPLKPKEQEPQSEFIVVASLKEIKDENKRWDKRDQIEKEINELKNKYAKEYQLLFLEVEDIWDSCLKNNFDLIKTLVSSTQLYDTGWLMGIKSAEAHKLSVLRQFREYVVSYVVAGSLARGEATEKSDLDTYVVIDDTDVSRMPRPELIARLRAMILSEAARISPKLHCQVYILTDMWDSIRNANPVIFTFLRDGIPLFDRGLFAPWKLLLKQGRIKPSPEAVDTYIKSGNEFLQGIKRRILNFAMEDFFWAISMPIQGAVMLYGWPPPDPKSLAQVSREAFVKTGLLEEEYASFIEKCAKLRKDVEHGVKTELSPKEFDDYMTQAEKYMTRIKKLYEEIDKLKVKDYLSEAQEVVFKSIKAALVLVAGEVKSKSDEEILRDFKKEVVNRHLAKEKFYEIGERILDAKIKKTKITRLELNSILFEEEKLSSDMFTRIGIFKGQSFEKYKLTVNYPSQKNKETKANVWLLDNNVYVVKDIDDPSSQILKFQVTTQGKLENQSKSTLAEINKKLGESPKPTKITEHTISSLKDILHKDLWFTVGA